MTMTMGSTKREIGVLKLVHPGGLVEVHNTPITAIEVMNKNPQHCVTRPDVFKYPWIVVRPDSVLQLGRVFFVVPNHTLRSLLKASESWPQRSSNRTNLTPKHLDHNPQLTQKYEVQSLSEATPNHCRELTCKQKLKFESSSKETTILQEDKRHLKKQKFVDKSRGATTPSKQDYAGCFKQQSRFELAKVSPEVQNHDRCLQLVPFEPRVANPKPRNRSQQPKQLSLIRSCYEATPKRPDQHHVQMGCWGEISTLKHPKNHTRDRHLPRPPPGKPTPSRQQSPKKEKSVFVSSTKLEPLHDKSGETENENGGDQLGFSLIQHMELLNLNLKSCLRKPNAKSQRPSGLKVKFVLPTEDEQYCLSTRELININTKQELDGL